MANTPEVTSMALFCDFENVALGVRDAKYADFDISKVLERLLLRGNIVVKKRSEEEFFTPTPITSLLFSRSLETSGEKSESPLMMTKVSTWDLV
jgi:hypothetical protein